MLDNFDIIAVKSAADLFNKLGTAMGLDQEKKYYDRKSNLSPEEYEKTLAASTTLYVGGMTPFIFENHLVSYFS